jgi:hypothetical protein
VSVTIRCKTTINYANKQTKDCSSNDKIDADIKADAKE